MTIETNYQYVTARNADEARKNIVYAQTLVEDALHDNNALEFAGAAKLSFRAELDGLEFLTIEEISKIEWEVIEEGWKRRMAA